MTLTPTVSSITMSNQRGSSLPHRQQGVQPHQLSRNRAEDGFWGDEITNRRSTSSARFGFQNINGMPIQNNSKSESLIDIIKHYEFDYFGIQEVNLHERILPPSQQWKRKFHCIHTKAATNQHCPSQRRILYGGTAHFLSHEMCLRQINSGQDETGLGRWVWTLLQGRQGIQVRIISGYRPIEDKSNRPHTVYSQHEYYYRAIDQSNGYRNPRKSFFEDLDNSIKSWMEAGDQIILGLDANEDIHSRNLQQWIESWGLVDALHRHHPHHLRTATCNKNSNNVPIDGIFISPGLHIQAAGMTGFGELYADSDHRLLWVDIHMESLFGCLPPTPDKRPENSLPIRDPRAMKKYNKYVKQQFEIHKIAEKTFALEVKASEGEFSIEDRIQYNNILCIQNDIRRRARKRCRRFYTSQIMYTEELGSLYRRRKLWKLIKLKRSNVRVDLRTIRRLMQQVNEPMALQASLEDAEKHLCRTIKEWKKYKAMQSEKREQFEIQIDKRRAQKLHTSTETQTKQRKNTGATRSIFRRIRQVMKPRESLSINTVEYTTEAGNIIECLSRENIEQACIKEGQRRFSQTQRTPFLRGSLLQQLGFNADRETTSRILNGDYIPNEDVAKYTHQFIQELAMPECIRNLPKIHGAVTTEDHCKSWKKMRLQTGSSPYGPLFCDYIAATHDPEVSEVDASLSSIPFMAGFSPSQWQEATDVMIPKKKSSRHVQKLRIIVLFDAMFNMVNKRIARQMIQRAQDYKLLPNEAYGGVPRRCATTCSLNKVLAMDLIRIEKRTATVCSNDAKSCYDRIVHTVASICMQRLGVAAETCFTMFNTLQELNHHVRTAYGERASGYGAVQIPLQGVGQGNGAGPAIWLAITIPLINMLRKAGFGLKISTPMSKEESTLTCFVYVDDVDSIHSPGGENVTPQSITADTQRMLNTWAGGLYATGGMIEAEKSYWYLIDFKWNARKLSWEYKSIAETPATLHLRHDDEQPTVLCRKEVSDPGQDGTLGTFIAMDGNQRAVILHLTNQVNEWADKIRTRQLTTQEGWLSFRTGISMSIRHQLATSRLTQNECKQITRQLKRAILQASGLPTTYPDALVYAPREYLGLGIPNLWHVQATMFADHCLQHASDPGDPTGLLMRSIIQTMRLEMGVSRSPLLYPFSRWNKCTTPTQFFPFWEYASEIGLELRDGLSPIQKAREGDSFLMEVFEQNGYTPQQLRMLNICRLHLKIMLVSDLCTGDGWWLDKVYLERRAPFHHHNQFIWPKAPIPNATCWKMWTNAVINCLTANHHERPYRLRTNLGDWTRAETKATTYFSSRQNMIYQMDSEGRYHCFRYFRTRPTRNPTFIRTTPSATLPSDAIPTTIFGNSHTVHHTGIANIRQLESEDDSEWWGIVTEASLRLDVLAEALAQGTAIAVTDGSYKDHMGTAAFTFRCDEHATESLTFVLMTPGMPDEITPFRAELSGLYGIAKFLCRIHRQFELTHGSIRIVCDCKGALDRTTSAYPPKTKHPNYDLLHEIYQLKQSAPFTWNPHWVRGHQDDTCAIQNLDPLAQINIAMDLLAKHHWNRLNLQRPAPFPLPSTEGTWSLWMHGQRISTWNRVTQDQVYFNPNARKYWHDKYESFPKMDFQSIRMAYKSLPLFYQLRVPKWITQRLPVGQRIARWDIEQASNCPRCGIENETHSHLVRCQHPGATTKINQWLNDLELWLTKQSTHPDIRFGILSLLRASLRGRSWVPPHSTEPHIRETFRQQHEQGTDNILFGWWATGWAEAQQLYLQSISRRVTGYRWLSRLIKKQWEIAWDLWRHRMEVAAQPTSYAVALAHDQTNTAIRNLYHRWSSSPPHPLQRWFQQPLLFILQEPLSFKQDWLTMVQSFVESLH